MKKLLLLLFLASALSAQDFVKKDANGRVLLNNLTVLGHYNVLFYNATDLDLFGKADNVPTFDTTNIGWSFDTTATSTIYGTAFLPYDYKLKSDIQPFIYWSPGMDTIGTAVFELAYKVAEADGALPSSYTADTLACVADSNDLKIQLESGFTDMNMGEISTSGGYFVWKFSRLPGETADTMATTALLRGIGFVYSADGIGSDGEFAKTR